MALGTNQEMRTLAGNNARIIGLDGRTTIPGMIQTHYHLFSSAARKYGPQYDFTDPSIQLSVTASTDVESTAKAIRGTVLNAIQAQNIPKDQWISVRVQDNKDNSPGTLRTWFYIGKINRRQLDPVVADHPVIVNMGLGG